SQEALPISPHGVVSPVVITRAMLTLLDPDLEVIDCGCFVPPVIPHLGIARRPARCLTTGTAIDEEHVTGLFEAGLKYAKEELQGYDYVMLAECVPGGTTTAEAVLNLLGYEVHGLISGSQPVPDYEKRRTTIARGLRVSPRSAQLPVDRVFS